MTNPADSSRRLALDGVGSGKRSGWRATLFEPHHADRAESEARRVAMATDVELVDRVAENVADELADVAVTRSAGIVVVGTEQTRGVFGPTLGEVATRLLDRGGLAVAVVPMRPM